ncbi:MAG: hypothetical protein LBS38_02890 [Endomicrobium sp.]|jgi:hypothetical protein|nr:hypothetical protein [Endomicrobium sp.]
MERGDFKGAKKEYRNAIEIQNDPETVMLYAAALINEIFGYNFGQIVADIYNNNGRHMLDSLSPETIARADRDLWELVNAPDFFPSVFDSLIPPADSDTNLNGAAVYILAGLSHVLNNTAIRDSMAIPNSFSIDSSFFPVNNSSAMDALKKLEWCLKKSLQCLNNISSNPGQLVSNLLPELQEMDKRCISLIVRG